MKNGYGSCSKKLKLWKKEINMRCEKLELGSWIMKLDMRVHTSNI